jgi:multiple sugar transport system ATP-binding protein
MLCASELSANNRKVKSNLLLGSFGTYLSMKGNEMAEVRFDNITRIYPGNDTPSVEDLSLDIKDGEFLVLVGPSGCGKSTTLRMLAGLEEVNKGSIYIGDKDVTTMQPKDRDIAMVFQNYALYPHMTVAENMGFALKIAGVDKAEIRKKVEQAAKILDLTEFLDRKPKALSGGQRQRVAMGRAIVREPKVFLMDEPLSNLDAKLRVQTRTQIAALQHQLGVTTLYVTHDQTEALTMGDRIAVLSLGKLQQVGAPTELYDRPANVFVAGFIGSPSMNINQHQVVNGQAKIGDDTVSLPSEAVSKLTADDNSQIILGFRPEDASLASAEDPDAFKLLVQNTEDLGSDGYVYGQIVSDESVIDTNAATAATMSDQNKLTTVRIPPRTLPKIGETVRIHIDPAKMHLFSPATGLRLN